MNYQRHKNVRDCNVGDFLRSGKYGVYKIVDETKTQWRCVENGKDETDKNNYVRVIKETGTIVGGGYSRYGRAHMSALQDGETPETIAQRKADANAKAKADREAQEKRMNDRLQAVKDANPELEFEYIGFDLQSVKFSNKAGQTGLIIFHLTPSMEYDYEQHKEIPALRIQSVSYAYHWHNDNERRLGSSHDVTALDRDEGIYALISQSYWD